MQRTHLLRQDVICEPTIRSWAAWTQLITPATSSLWMKNSQFPIMQSFIKDPTVHVAATSNPKLAGGPFVSLPEARADAMAKLVNETMKDCQTYWSLAASLEALDALLQAHPKGLPLPPLYSQIPEPLQGVVELHYDLHGNAGFRLFEALLYERMEQERLEGLSLSEHSADKRAFILSTPRLSDTGSIQLRLPYDSFGSREIFAARAVRTDPDQLALECDLAGDDVETFTSMFEERPEASWDRYTRNGVRVRYFGHACVLFETRDVSLLFDPFISSKAKEDRFSYADLPPVLNYVVISHGHQDHVIIETLLHLRHKVENVIVPRSSGGSLQDPSLNRIIQALGFKQITELSELETLPLPGGQLIGLPFVGEHCDLDIRSKLAYLVCIGQHRFAVAVDSANENPAIYQEIRRILGPIDTVFLGMECVGAPLSWLYGPLLREGVTRELSLSRRLKASDADQAWQIVKDLGAGQAFVYAMGYEPWTWHILTVTRTAESTQEREIAAFLQRCRATGIGAELLLDKAEMVLTP